MCHAGARGGAKEQEVDMVDFLFRKWYEMHHPIISRFNETLNSVIMNMQIPERIETVLERIDFDPAIFAHAILSAVSFRPHRELMEALSDVPREVIELLGFGLETIPQELVLVDNPKSIHAQELLNA